MKNRLKAWYHRRYGFLGKTGFWVCVTETSLSLLVPLGFIIWLFDDYLGHWSGLIIGGGFGVAIAQTIALVKGRYADGYSDGMRDGYNGSLEVIDHIFERYGVNVKDSSKNERF